MKFTINSSDLKSRLDVLNKVSRSKTTLPILSYLMMELDDERLTITASDLEVTVSSSVIPSDIKETGSICVLSSLFSDVVRMFKDEPIDISVDNKGNVVLKSKSGRFKIAGESADNFPMTQDVDESFIVDIPADEVMKGINKISFAVKKDELRPILGGILFDMRNSAMVMVSTDLFSILAMYKIECECPTKQIVLPQKLTSVLASVVNGTETYVQLSASEKDVRMSYGDYTIYSKQIEGNFPDYTKIVPKEISCSFSSLSADLIDSTKRVLLFSDVTTPVVKGEVKLGQVEIVCEDNIHGVSGEEIVLCDNIKDSGHFKTFGKRFYDSISRIDEEVTELSVSGTAITVKPHSEESKYMFVISQLA